MRPINVAILALILGSCTSPPRGDGAAGVGAPAGAAGTRAATGSAGTAGTGSGAPGSAGASASGAAGTSSAGVDNGQLFGDAAVVTLGQDPAPTADAAPSDIGSPPAAMGTLRINGLGLTALFTQKGADVTMVATATGCPQGNHTLQIHAGFSCDTAGTQGGVWDGKRGDGIPPLVCGADRKGSLTYTRSGADPATSWTVGDHSTKTDVTLHPVMAEGNCGTFL